MQSELLSDGANPGDVFDNANIVLPTDNTRTSNGNTVDVGNEPRWQASSGPNFMTRPVIMGGIVQMSGELSVQLSSGSDHSSSRATASHRLDRDIHLPGGHSRNATPNTAHRRGSHPTGVSDAVVSADSAAQTVEIIGDDFERDRAASVGALRTGSNSPAMSQESWEGRASNEAEECRKSDSYDENDISNNYDNIGNRDMFVSNSYNHEEEYVAALDGGDDDASSLEIQKALLMRLDIQAFIILCTCQLNNQYTSVQYL